MAAPTAPTLTTSTFYKTCNNCDEKLIPNVNWTRGMMKSYNYLCKTCKNGISEKWRRENGILVRQISKISTAKWRQKKRDKNIKYWENNVERRSWHSYKSGATKRGILFNLSFKEFMTFKDNNCFYCGEKVMTASGVGIDRYDNKKGYELYNLVPCCSQCNWMKSDLEKEDFIKHCIKIVEESKKCVQYQQRQVLAQ